MEGYRDIDVGPTPIIVMLDPSLLRDENKTPILTKGLEGGAKSNKGGKWLTLTTVLAITTRVVSGCRSVSPTAFETTNLRRLRVLSRTGSIAINQHHKR